MVRFKGAEKNFVRALIFLNEIGRELRIYMREVR